MALDLSTKASLAPLDLSTRRATSPRAAATPSIGPCVTMATACVPTDSVSVTNGNGSTLKTETVANTRKRKLPLEAAPSGDNKSSTPEKRVRFAMRDMDPNSVVMTAAGVTAHPRPIAMVTAPSLPLSLPMTSWCARRRMKQDACAAFPTNHVTSCCSPPVDCLRLSDEALLAEEEEEENVDIPADPRDWSRDDVHTWLRHVRRRRRLGDVDTGRFPCNGKGLCLMSLAMFVYRSPEAGAVLYSDFKGRVQAALARQTS